MMNAMSVIGIIIGIVLIGIVVVLLVIRAVYRIIITKEAEKLKENGGISELVELNVNGTKQYLLVEGQDKVKPILLFLHGGPGQPFPFGVSARGAFPQLTKDFLAVYYDQRGSGKSFSKDITLESMCIDQFIHDTDVVVNYLRERFKTDKVLIAGVSWGSLIGMKYSSRYPEKVQAYIGISQFVDNKETQRLSKEWLTEIALNKKNEKMMKDLESLGEPPFIGKEDKMLMKYISTNGGDNYGDEKVKKASILGLIHSAFVSPDYSLGDIYKAMVSGATFSLLKAKDLQNEIYQVNFTEEVTNLTMPVYIFQGKYDNLTNYELTKKFIKDLSAPKGKEFVTLEQSAHYPNNEDFTVIFEKLKEISLKEK